eukprot:g13051.t1
MSRLGVWGAGTAFDTFHDFKNAIVSNGVAAMEMFAMNMKAIGAMSCRALAYVGTEFELQQNGMTQAVRGTQKLLTAFKTFIHSKDLKETYRKHFFRKMQQKKAPVSLSSECFHPRSEDGQEPALSRKNSKELKEEDEEEDFVIKRLWQFYWGAQQRFFKALCNSAKVPAACVAAQEAVEKGQQVVISIWGTGEARSRVKMDKLREETAGRVTLESVSDGITEVEVKQQDTMASIASCLYANLSLKSKVSIAGKQVPQLSRLVQADGKRVNRSEDTSRLEDRNGPMAIRAPTKVVSARAPDSDEPVSMELADDDLGERVVVSKVLEGPPSLRRAELEGWHVKKINDKPVGKIRVAMIRQRMKKGTSLSFQDPVIDDHLSGPAMVVEPLPQNGSLAESGCQRHCSIVSNTIRHFINSCFLSKGPEGEEETQHLNLPPNALDDLLDRLGGLKKVAEMSGRSHRIKRRKDGSLAWVARCEDGRPELRCLADGANLVEQVLFQKGSKKICVVTEVASAGISLHADRRQATQDFQPPRRLMISLELPWGADKASRQHAALKKPRPLGGEVRFNSAIARRMKLLGAVTKGDRMTSMGGVADQAMTDFDVNNAYGLRALATFYIDTAKMLSAAPELLALYEALPFIGCQGDGEATGKWPTWEAFVEDVNVAWSVTKLWEEIEFLVEDSKSRFGASSLSHGMRSSFRRSWAEMGTKESPAINRFFNRILMLEEWCPDTFFALYSELVRVDKQNGQSSKVDSKELLYKDPCSGAETTYIRLALDPGISWEAAKAAYDEMPKGGSVEGFYEYRPLKETIQLGGAGATGTTWIARRRQRQFSIWRPDYGAVTGWSQGHKVYFEADLCGDRFSPVYGTEKELDTVKAAWIELYEKTAAKRTVMEHILTGDVLTAWQLVNDCSRLQRKDSADRDSGPKLQIVRATTQPDGLPVVGMRLREEDLPQLKYVLSCQQQAAELPNQKWLRSVKEACVHAAELLLLTTQTVCFRI